MRHHMPTLRWTHPAIMASAHAWIVIINGWARAAICLCLLIGAVLVANPVRAQMVVENMTPGPPIAALPLDLNDFSFDLVKFPHVLAGDAFAGDIEITFTDPDTGLVIETLKRKVTPPAGAKKSTVKVNRGDTKRASKKPGVKITIEDVTPGSSSSIFKFTWKETTHWFGANTVSFLAAPNLPGQLPPQHLVIPPGLPLPDPFAPPGNVPATVVDSGFDVRYQTTGIHLFQLFIADQGFIRLSDASYLVMPEDGLFGTLNVDPIGQSGDFDFSAIGLSGQWLYDAGSNLTSFQVSNSAAFAMMTMVPLPLPLPGSAALLALALAMLVLQRRRSISR